MFKSKKYSKKPKLIVIRKTALTGFRGNSWPFNHAKRNKNKNKFFRSVLINRFFVDVVQISDNKFKYKMVKLLRA